MPSDHIPTSVVGSITRPTWLVEARRAFEQGDIEKKELDRLADLAVELTVNELEKTGIDEISDGEQRRTNFFEFLTENVKGLASNKVKRGEFASEKHFEPAVVGKIKLDEPIAVREFQFTKKHTRKPVKIALPPITKFLSFYPSDGVSGYTRDEFTEDAIRLLRSEYRALLDAGAERIQLDLPDITPYSAQSDRKKITEDLTRAIDLINSTIKGLPQERLHVHICFGNYKATHRLTGGSFKNLIPELYDLNVLGYLLELANPQHEDDVEIFKEYPVPRGKSVYAGVIDVKTPDVEPLWLVTKRIDRVAKYIDRTRLGLTTDCGFAPGWYNNVIPRNANFQKLKALVNGAVEWESSAC